MLHMSVSTLERLVADGKFPRPLPTGDKTKKVWAGADVACWLFLAGKMIAEQGGGSEK